MKKQVSKVEILHLELLTDEAYRRFHKEVDRNAEGDTLKLLWMDYEYYRSQLNKQRAKA